MKLVYIFVIVYELAKTVIELLIANYNVTITANFTAATYLLNVYCKYLIRVLVE